LEFMVNTSGHPAVLLWCGRKPEASACKTRAKRSKPW